MHNALLNNIATQIVADKVMEDKMKEFQDKQEEEENNNKPKKEGEEQVEDDDDIFKEDEDELKMIQEMKEKRMMEQGFKPKARDRSREKKQIKYKYGEYREIDESEFLDTLIKNEKVICHFFHEEFEKCKIMDKHLAKIAYEHPETLFVKINAQKSAFFSVKLNIKVLPTVLFSVNGKVIERIIGFEGLDGEDDFIPLSLVRKLVVSKMIKPKNKMEKGEVKIKKTTKFSNNQDDSEDEDDYDI